MRLFLGSGVVKKGIFVNALRQFRRRFVRGFRHEDTNAFAHRWTQMNTDKKLQGVGIGGLWAAFSSVFICVYLWAK